MSKNPTNHPALPDDLLLDLVEGRLRAGDVERVRTALKAEPALAARLEAMRADRARVMSLSDAGVAPAPAGLVTMALEAVEHEQILEAPTPEPGGSAVRRLAPALLAACVGIVAVASWYVTTQSSSPANPGGADQTASADTVEDDGPDFVMGAITDEQIEERNRPLKLAEEVGGALPDSFGKIEMPEGFASSTVDDSGAVGAPVDPTLVAQSDRETDTTTDPAALAWAEDNDEDGTTGPTRARLSVNVPDNAFAWARTGSVRVVLSQGDTAGSRSKRSSASVRRSLALVYDPSLSGGWGVTSLPAVRIDSFAANGDTDAPTGGTVGTSTDRTSVSVRVDENASDEALQNSLLEMATRLSAITGLSVTLEETMANGSGDAGRMALDADTLLWWSRPPASWSTQRVYDMPVVLPE